VTSKGTSVLAAPIRYETDGAGAFVPPGTDVRVVSATDTTVVLEAACMSGGLNAFAECTFDYDGMMKVAIKVAQRTNPATVGLDLVIPLREEIAKLMHVCGDGLRFNYAGEVPKGEVVFKAVYDYPEHLEIEDHPDAPLVKMR
jgi:hypothetical protein